MNRKIIKQIMVKIGACVCLLVPLLFQEMSAQAASEPSTNAMGFTYKIDYPDSQLGDEKGYFDLLLKPGQEQTVKLILSNSSKSKVTVDVGLNGTKTNPNGVIEYGTTEIENDASLKFPFERIVSGPKSVDIKGGEIKTVELKVKMPETSFDGVVLGGIYLRKTDQNETTKDASGATVLNEYSYLVAMVLKNNESEVMPEIALNKAGASQRNFRNSMSVNLSNVAATLVSKKMAIETQITKKGSQKVLYERKQTGMSIAPNSQMDFYVSMNGERMVAGKYTANVLVTIDKQKWEKSLDFVVTDEEADKYNKRDVGLVQDRGLDWKLVALIVGGVLVVVIIIFVVIKGLNKKKRNQAEKDSRGKKKSKRPTTSKKR